MKNTKVVTVIVNCTQRDLVLRVGSHICFAKLATIVNGGEYKIEFDINWTYQEFLLEPAHAGHQVPKKTILSSDDCCDFERITVKISEGKLQLEKVARGRIPKDIVDNHLPVNPVVANWRSVFKWPKFNWRFWF